ncbi:hypothetical protein C449_14092 [Halococcus saccharolyticus DSM 5350]|uniref:Uncharacterized protein n=1 Tax=Halococcus saccharolyticus DSM 5350 TaxID=1227455 RepID=M0MFB9_9EURY|nr:hypothetical protein C449_14092 [Halococcus saccharolyticus DSM 5350]
MGIVFRIFSTWLYIKSKSYPAICELISKFAPTPHAAQVNAIGLLLSIDPGIKIAGRIYIRFWSPRCQYRFSRVRNVNKGSIGLNFINFNQQ